MPYTQLIENSQKQTTLLFDLKRWWKCNIKVLIVTDSNSGGYTTTTGFHLGKVLEAIESHTKPNVNFQFTKAHRQASSSADIENFQFDSHSLGQYSQIWLFGISSDQNPLSQSELKVLSQFMDQGGGIFATGDQQQIGKSLCADIPRVRSMRKWHGPTQKSNEKPVIPDNKTPQSIMPYQHSRSFNSAFITKETKYTHPVLSGQNHCLSHLPSHQHNGKCKVPSDLTQRATFDGYTTTEYPSLDGRQEQPKIVANTINIETRGNQFGILAAYDGQRVGIGRVIVDSTWQHWFNINLSTYIDSSDPNNPNFDPSAAYAWEEIKNYYCNVANWLANSQIQACLRNNGWFSSTLFFEVLVLHRKLNQVDNQFNYFWQLGTVARDALGHLATQCQMTQWFVDALQNKNLLQDPWDEFASRKPQLFNIEEIETVMLGGIVHEITQQFENTDISELMENNTDKIDSVAQIGATQAIASYMQRFQLIAKEASQYLP